MKQNFLSTLMMALAFTFGVTMASCSDDDAVTTTIDTSLPNGNFSVARSGALTAQSNTPTQGTVELGTDEDNVNFVRFSNDFTTELATGTVSVYFSTSDTFTADPGAGNPDLILAGPIQSNGEQFIKLNQIIPSNFTHVILWCNTAGVPFGNAAIQ